MAGFKKDGEKKASFFASRKFKYGSAATALTITFVAVVIIINVIFSLLADSYSWRMDMTSYDLYSISQDTKDMVDALTDEETIEIYVMYAEEEYREDVRESIKRFANLSDKIELSFINTDVNPQALKDYNAEVGSIVVKSSLRDRVISFDEIYVENTMNGTATGTVTYKTEEALASAVSYVTQKEVPKVYFLTGRGESGYEAFMELLKKTGADVEAVQLNQLKEIDPAARCMVLCGPTEDYPPAEIRKIQDFLANQYNYERNLMYFGNPGTKELPNLKTFLAEWGIEVRSNLVLEDTAHSVSGFDANDATAPLYMQVGYEGTEINGKTLVVDYPALIPFSASVNLLFNNNTDGNTNTAVLMKTSEGSYAKSGEEVSSTYDKEPQDEEGPFNVAVIASRYKSENNVPVYSHVFAAGSTVMLDQVCFDYSGNDEFLTLLYQTMVGEEDLEIYAAQKQTATSSMVLDDLTVRWTTIVFVGVIPGIFLIIGIAVFIRRRYL